MICPLTISHSRSSCVEELQASKARLLKIRWPGTGMMMISGSFNFSKRLLYFWCELLEKGWSAIHAGGDDDVVGVDRGDTILGG